MRLLSDHLRAGIRASLLVAFLVALTVFAAAIVPRVFASVATAELQYQLGQERPVRLDLTGEGRAGLLTGLVTAEALLTPTGNAIDEFAARVDRPLADGLGSPVWLVKSASGAGTTPGDENVVLALRLAVDLDWTDRITFVAGAEPRVDTSPVEVAISQNSATAMKVGVGDILEYASGPLRVAGIYEPIDPDDTYWSHAYDLARPSIIRETGKPPKIQASLYIAPDAMVPLVDDFSSGALVAWIPVDPNAYSFADREVLATQARNLTATPVSLPDYGQLTLRSSFTDVIETTEGKVAAMSALIALAGSGLLGVLIATYALSIQALVRRRRTALSLASARGASLGQLRAVMVIEAALISLPGAAIAVAVAAALVPERVGVDGWLAPIALAVIPVALAAVLVAPGSLRESRRDISVRSSSRTRWVLEAALAGAAVIALVLLQRRGLVASSDVVGIDPLLAATPVLLAAAVGLLALRLFPIPLRAVRALVRRGIAPVAEVGSARAVREPAIGAIATLSLIVGVSIVVFSTIMVSTVGASMQRAAEEVVGADARVNAHDLPVSLVDELRDLPGVTGAVALTVQPDVTLTDDAGDTRTRVALADPAELAIVRPDLPELTGATDGRLPVFISQALDDLIQGTDLRLAGVPIEVVGVVPDASVQGLLGKWLVVDDAAAEDLGIAGQVPSRVLLNLADDYTQATVDAITDAVLAAQPEQFVGSARIYDVHSELAQRRAAPITAALEAALVITAGATLALTLLIIALAAAASAASRNRVVGVLRIIGMTPRQVRALVAWEFAPVAVAALVVGTALGIGLPFLVTAVLDLRGFFGGTSVPTATLDPAAIALAVAIYAITILGAVLTATALGRRFAPASTLKMGES